VDLGPELGDPALSVGMAVELVLGDVESGTDRLKWRPA